IRTEVLRQTAISIGGAFPILLPQHEVPVLARAGEELCGLRDGHGMDLVAVTAQHLGFGPRPSVPETDGLIRRRGDQTSSVFGEGQLAHPTGMAVEPGEEPASSPIPNADRGVFISR